MPAGDIAFLASSEEVDGLTGLYWRDRRPKPSARRSYDEADARRLWGLREGMLSALGFSPL